MIKINDMTLREWIEENCNIWALDDYRDVEKLLNDFINDESTQKLRLSNFMGQAEQLSRCKCGAIVKIECENCMEDRISGSLES